MYHISTESGIYTKGLMLMYIAYIGIHKLQTHIILMYGRNFLRVFLFTILITDMYRFSQSSYI